MKSYIYLFIILILTSCAPRFGEDRVEIFNVYAVAIPFLPDDVTMNMDYDGSITNFIVETYFIPLKTTSSVEYIPEEYAHAPGDYTQLIMNIPLGYTGFINETNELSFVGHTSDKPSCYVHEDMKFEPEWFMTEVGSITWSGSNVSVYRLATVHELNAHLDNDISTDYPFDKVDVNISTYGIYTNDITTNYYEVDIRNKTNSLAALSNNITVDSNTYALMEALGDAYYPQSGKLYLTIDGWPDWPW